MAVSADSSELAVSAAMRFRIKPRRRPHVALLLPLDVRVAPQPQPVRRTCPAQATRTSSTMRVTRCGGCCTRQQRPQRRRTHLKHTERLTHNGLRVGNDKPGARACTTPTNMLLSTYAHSKRRTQCSKPRAHRTTCSGRSIVATVIGLRGLDAACARMPPPVRPSLPGSGGSCSTATPSSASGGRSLPPSAAYTRLT